MLKRIRALVLAAAFVVFSVTGALAAQVQPPRDVSHPLSVSEIRTILSKDTTGAPFLDIYDELISRNPEAVPGMQFAIDPSDPNYDAALEAYGDWIVHFGIKATTPMDVILLGSFEAYQGGQPVPIGPFSLQPNKEVMIMDEFAKLWFGIEKWPGTYDIIAALVGTFNCIAIPVTTDVKEVLAGYPELGVDLSSSPNVDLNNTSLTVTMYLVPPENNTTDDPIAVDSETFFGHRIPSVPRTGDSFLPVLCAMLTASSALGMLALRKKRFAR